MTRSSVLSAFLALGSITVCLPVSQSSSAQSASSALPADSIQVQSPSQAQTPAQPATPSLVLSPSQVPIVSPKPTVTFTQPPPSQEDVGDSYVMHQRYQAAIAAYRSAPQSAAVWNKMGIAYQMMLNVREASRCYKQSIRLDPHNAQVINNLATVYDSEKQFGAAEHLYRKALKVNPRSAMVYKNLGTNLLAQHKYNRGWDAYQQALAIDPGIFEDHGTPQVQNPASIAERGAMNYYMALGCVRMGQTECALQYLRMALDEGFTNPKKVAADVAFASLRDNADFKQLLASQENAKPEQAR